MVSMEPGFQAKFSDPTFISDYRGVEVVCLPQKVARQRVLCGPVAAAAAPKSLLDT